MSCPDWRRLVALREEDPSRDPDGWEAARRHLADCAPCRREAIAADPLLVFAPRAATPTPAAREAEMLASVTALVRAERLAERRRALASSTFGRLAAGLGVLALLSLSGAPSPRQLPAPAAQVAGVDGLAGTPPAAILEDLDRPDARVYELPQSDIALVMIVDASLDV